MRIPVITGSLQESYKVLDSISAYAVGKAERSFDFDIEIKKCFENVTNDLRSACKALGGNAVINCKFECRNLPYYKHNQQVSRSQIFVHGTAVLSSIIYTDAIIDSKEKTYSLNIDNSDCVHCPICKEILRLDSYEIKSFCFQCTNCKNEIKFKIEAM